VLEFFKFDADYVKRLIEGDAQTEQHFTAYFSQLITIKLRARQYTSHVIEDIRQETFARVFQSLRAGDIRHPERIGAFVNSVCNHVMLEFGRAGSRLEPMKTETDVVSETAGSDDMLVTAETQQEVRNVLAKLTPLNRRLLTMLFVEEQSKDVICDELGVDREYLRVLLFRARAEFRTRMMKRKNLREVSA
jgi:RNA polymerase sigma-70 factor (ECF subfamily)